MSPIDKPILGQALLGAAALALAASIVAYQRFHQIAAPSADYVAPTPAAAEPDVPTVVVTARRGPATRDDRETASARRLASRSTPDRDR
jgi:hypothetical protein